MEVEKPLRKLSGRKVKILYSIFFSCLWNFRPFAEGASIERKTSIWKGDVFVINTPKQNDVFIFNSNLILPVQPVFTCSSSTIETQEAAKKSDHS